MLLRTLMSLLLIFCILFCGCGKKKKADEAADQAEIESVTTEESDDIFDEFYDEEGEKKEEPDNFSTPSSTPQFDPNGRYVVQVSCVLSKALAQDVVAKLENKGYPTYIAEVDNPTPDLIGTYQRIRIGGFNGISTAKNFAVDYLTPEGYDYWVDNRSNDNVGMGGYEGLGQSSGGGYERGYTSEPATTPPAEDWGASEPEPVPATTSEPAAQAPADDWGTSEPVTTPAAATTTTIPEPAAQPPAKTTPESDATTAEDEWGEAEDEWGSDTTGW